MGEIDFMGSYILKSEDAKNSYTYCDLTMCSVAQEFCNAYILVVTPYLQKLK